MNIFLYIKSRIVLHRAIRKADKAHRLNPTSAYFVVLNDKNALVVIDKNTFQYYKRKKIVNPRATINDLYRECYYFTAGKGGLNPITPHIKKLKQKMYIHHINQLKKQGK